ncbi:MAG: hypothetical protein AAFU85_00860 [Planctomycetota bacterium]
MFKRMFFSKHLFAGLLSGGLLLLQCGPASSQDSSSGRESVISTIYGVGELPIYRWSGSGEPVFDASTLISHLKQTVDPGSWQKPASMTAIASSKALLVSQTRANHQAIASVLYRMRLCTRPVTAAVLNRAFESAENTNRRVLLCVTEPTSDGFERFLNIFQSEDQQDLASNFVFITIRNDRLLELQDSVRDTLALRRDELVVFDAARRLISRRSLFEPTHEGDVTSWLVESAVALESADVLLRRGLDQAKAQDKRVLLVYLGPACVHCDRMKAFLKAFDGEFSTDYVPVIVETRMAGAPERTAALGRTEDEIPWLAILSSDGQPRATSESKFGNIGFPTDRDGWLHFYRMIDDTRVRMSDEAIEKIFGSLIAETSEPR